MPKKFTRPLNDRLLSITSTTHGKCRNEAKDGLCYVNGRKLTKTKLRKIVSEQSSRFGRRVSRKEAVAHHFGL